MVGHPILCVLDDGKLTRQPHSLAMGSIAHYESGG